MIQRTVTLAKIFLLPKRILAMSARSKVRCAGRSPGFRDGAEGFSSGGSAAIVLHGIPNRPRSGLRKMGSVCAELCVLWLWTRL